MTRSLPSPPSAAAHDRKVVLGAALATLATLPFLVGGGAVVAGWAGVYGAVLGVLLTAGFFGVTVFAVAWARKAGIVGLAGVVLGTYTAKVVLLGVVLVSLGGTTVLHRPTFGVAVAVGVVVFLAAEVRLALGSRVPYVDVETVPTASGGVS